MTLQATRVSLFLSSFVRAAATEETNPKGNLIRRNRSFNADNRIPLGTAHPITNIVLCTLMPALMPFIIQFYNYTHVRKEKIYNNNNIVIMKTVLMEIIFRLDEFCLCENIDEFKFFGGRNHFST
mgnify:CR=1 FL=1